MVSNETIGAFRDVIKDEFDVALSDKDASEILLNWVAYFDLLAKIDGRKDVQVS